MATVTWGAELLRMDRRSWVRYHHAGTVRSAALVAVGAYAVFAFDRFGFLAILQPRPAVRLILTGLYAWLGLALAAWALGRFLGDADVSFDLVVRLYGYAHLPLLVVAITIQFTAMLLQILGPALVLSFLAVAVWMPFLLIAATRQVFEVDARRATILVAAPYGLWLLVIGRTLVAQVGHLL